MEEKKKKINIKKIIYFGLLTFFALVFLFCAIYIGTYMWDSHKNSDHYDDLSDLRDQNMTTAPPETSVPGSTGAPPQVDPSDPSDPSEPSAPSVPTEPDEPSILPELEAIYQLNNDLVGWISFPDSKINYPVLQTPDNPNYYLYRDFYGDTSRWGAIYVNEKCDVNKPSDNVTIYGHNMKDGQMFGTLKKWQFKDYWEEHPTFNFDTLYERRTYQIFAVFKTTAIADEGFQYHAFIDAKDEAAFDKFISTIKRLDFYDTGITPVYGDKIVLLSTCESTLAHGRFVVCAVLVDE